MPLRFGTALRYFVPDIGKALAWTFNSRELANFTYDLTDANVAYLAHAIAVVTGSDLSFAKSCLREIQADDSLKGHVLARTATREMKHRSDPSCHFGRRIGWYAFARILKPRLIVETGVDRGHGALVLCAALLRNKAEGYEGRYLGTDINPRAGFLFTKPYNDMGEILYGDSIESLKQLRDIDLFINDSDHSAEYEYREYLTVAGRLSPGAVILGDNAHVSNSLQQFSEEHNRQFLFFPERPKDHWYPGSGIGISYDFSCRNSAKDTVASGSSSAW